MLPQRNLPPIKERDFLKGKRSFSFEPIFLFLFCLATKKKAPFAAVERKTGAGV